MDTDQHRWGKAEAGANRTPPIYGIKLWLLAVLILVSGCGLSNVNKHGETVKSGVLVIPQVDELVKLYPNFPNHHAITHFGFDKSKPVRWNTLVYLHQRYRLHFTVDVVVDYERNTIKSLTGNQEFFLYETIAMSRGGNEDIGEQWRFGVADWNKVVAANGDFTQIGIVLKTNAPIPGWEKRQTGMK